MSSKVLERRIARRQESKVLFTEVDIEDIAVTRVIHPVIVNGDKLEIDSAQLETERVYSFDYLGVKMVLWKLPDGTIDLFQIIEE